MHHDDTLVHEDAALTRDEGGHDVALDYDTPLDAALQRELESIDASLRQRFGMTDADTACGIVDLVAPRVALVRPDRIEYGASVPKIGILLAYFVLRPEAAKGLEPDVRRDLGLMAKASSNETASRFSQELGLRAIQQVLCDAGFYDASRGGGIWVGKHYGLDIEKTPDPVGGHSHGATVRQVLRFWQLLDRGRLVSPEASRQMRECFAAPEMPHDDIKFVQGLRERTNVRMLRKWGSWENWLHDSAIITGPGRRYALAALTNHANGDAYLAELAKAVDDVMQRPGE
ncbi:hypothetical protein EON77_17295 [bacterium]|nr:MAG: hypothetical protein EON77_17295 [bacterium]